MWCGERRDVLDVDVRREPALTTAHSGERGPDDQAAHRMSEHIDRLAVAGVPQVDLPCQVLTEGVDGRVAASWVLDGASAVGGVVPIGKERAGHALRTE